MKLSFRWIGDSDPVSLKYIKQIPTMHSIASAIYDIPVGEVWPVKKIIELKNKIEEAGLHLGIIESLPIHEDIKLGLPTRDQLIENYKQSIKNLAKADIRLICYNFMPIFDWTRTQLDKELEDGSTTLVYYKDQITKMNPLKGKLKLPGWDTSYKKEELAVLFEQYSHVDREKLWDNLAYFLEAVIPTAEQCGVNMAIHPDDPPWSIFGLPRIIKNEKALDRLLKIVDSKSNGLAICTGSLGSRASNDVVKIVDKFSKMGRIHFVHARNVKVLPDRSFEESAHHSSYGSLDMVEILRALQKNGFDGYIRPDHGRMIWGETGKPGYGLYDRALGASYISGIWETLEKINKCQQGERTIKHEYTI